MTKTQFTIPTTCGVPMGIKAEYQHNTEGSTHVPITKESMFIPFSKITAISGYGCNIIIETGQYTHKFIVDVDSQMGVFDHLSSQLQEYEYHAITLASKK